MTMARFNWEFEEEAVKQVITRVGVEMSSHILAYNL